MSKSKKRSEARVISSELSPAKRLDTAPAHLRCDFCLAQLATQTVVAAEQHLHLDCWLALLRQAQLAEATLIQAGQSQTVPTGYHPQAVPVGWIHRFTFPVTRSG